MKYCTYCLKDILDDIKISTDNPCPSCGQEMQETKVVKWNGPKTTIIEGDE